MMDVASASEIRDSAFPQKTTAGGTCITALPEALDDDQCHTPSWTSQTEWATANEVCQTPLISPRLQGVSTAKNYSELLCIPKVDRSSTASHYENDSDFQLQALQQILEEQRCELHRVADVFQRRLSALCQAKYAAAPITPRQVLSPRPMATGGDTRAVGAEPAIDSRAVGKASSEFARSHSPGSRTNPEEGKRLSCTNPDHERASFSSDGIPFSHLDFRLLRGWEKSGSQSHSGSHSTIQGLKQLGQPTKRRLHRIIHSTQFDALSCLVITFDAVVNGISADHAARNPGSGKLEFYALAEVVFLFCYTIELLLRVCADEYHFFFSGWNVCDCILVGVDGFSQVYYASASGKENNVSSVAAARLARMLRLLRALRVFRLVRFLRELRMMVKCIIACGKTIVWVMLLMFMLIYIFAVYLTGQVAVARFEGDQLDSGSHLVGNVPWAGNIEGILKHRFGTVTDACFSLFMAISGGISWGDFADPLISLHWTNGIVVLIFVFFTVFAMLNIITGVFVDGALTAGHSDEEEIVQDIIDDEGSNLQKIRLLFEHANSNDDDVLTLEEFESQLANPEIRILFKSIGIGVHEVRGLFRLLDLDSSGEVTLEEFITGCMRLREGAFQSIDLCTILYENKRMIEKWKTFAGETKLQFKSLHEHISSISAPASTRDAQSYALMC